MDRFGDHLTAFLPGGYLDGDGTLQREVELAPFTGREEELLAGRYQPGQSAARVTTLLQRCIRRLGTLGPASEDVARGLLVADRQYLLLKLRELTLGDHVRATLCCPWPDCGKKVMVSFSTNAIPVVESVDKGPLYRMELSPEAAFAAAEGERYREVSFRLPTGGDQEALSPLLEQNEARTLTLLLRRCLRSIGPLQNPDEDAVARLSPLARLEIEREMERVAPKVELSMESQCSECGRDYTVPFDLQDFFFSELRISRELLYREVHYLAYHYHWSEREIMDLSRPKRRAYIEILADEIEKLNNAVA